MKYYGDEIDKAFAAFYNRMDEPRTSWLERNHLRLTDRGNLLMGITAAASVVFLTVLIVWMLWAILTTATGANS